MMQANTSSYYPYNSIKQVERKTVRGLKQESTVVQVKRMKPDIILSLFSKEIIPPSIFSIPRYGAVNLHPAPLPDYRGVSPTFWVLAEGKKMHGVTLHTLTHDIDIGTIIGQRKFSIHVYKSEHDLYMRCVQEGIDLVSSYLYEVRKKKKKIVGLRMKGKGSYRSIPTKQAVGMFLSRGYRFL